MLYSNYCCGTLRSLKIEMALKVLRERERAAETGGGGGGGFNPKKPKKPKISLKSHFGCWVFWVFLGFLGFNWIFLRTF